VLRLKVRRRLFFARWGGLRQGQTESDPFQWVERVSRIFQVFETLFEVVRGNGDPVKRTRPGNGEHHPQRQNRDHRCLANHPVSKTTLVTAMLVGATGHFGLKLGEWVCVTSANPICYNEAKISGLDYATLRVSVSSLRSGV
jgi:hypothetical protein